MSSAPAGLLSRLAAGLQRRLCLVDVGCRWGPDGAWSVLGSHARVIGFDADPEECRALAERFAGNDALRFVPRALGAQPGTRQIHLTKSPACASLYPPNQAAIDRFPGMEVITPAGTATVEVTTLDRWTREEGVEEVDFIKIDTQGAELEVLQGARRTLEGVRMLEVEVQFNPIYEGVPLFGEVDRFLREHGFVLWRLSNLAHYGLAGDLSQFARPEVMFFDESHPVSFTGAGGQLWWANAFYVRREVAEGAVPEDRQTALRDVCLAGILGFWDLAVCTADLIEG